MGLYSELESDQDDSSELEDTLNEVMASTPDPSDEDEITPNTTEPVQSPSEDEAEEVSDDSPAEPTDDDPPAEAEEPEPVQFEPVSDLDQVDLSTWDLPEAARPRVQQLVDFTREVAASASQAVAKAVAKEEEYKAAEAELRSMLDSLGDDAPEKALAGQMEQKNQVIHALNEQITSLSFGTFFDRYGSQEAWVKAVPSKTRNFFADMIESGTDGYLAPQFTKDTNTLLDVLDNAFDYACWKTGFDPKAAKEASETPTASSSRKSKPKAQPRQAKKQAVLAADKTPPQQPVRNVHEMSLDEILNRHDHLLD